MDAIMTSSIMQADTSQDVPDLLLDAEMESLSLTGHLYEFENSRSFVIIDSKELLRVENFESFLKKLNLSDSDKQVKVVSIFGNSGDGKSHTMNHLFFDGAEIFKMSAAQNSCTMGVMAAYQQFFYNHPILCIDTEGLQGVSVNENQQHRMLMKVLAVSDIVIYRTRAERLNADMYKFLATASKSYVKHLSPILAAAAASTTTTTMSTSTAIGPEVIIFHETRNTGPLESNLAESPEDMIRDKFSEMRLSIDAFSSLKYVGIKTNNPPTDYSKLKSILKSDIENKSRPTRSIRSIYRAMVLLNEKFSGNLGETQYTWHERHFNCEMVCDACTARCENTKDHVQEGIEHNHAGACVYQQQMDNKIYLCKRCHINGRRSIVKVNNNNNNPAWLGIAKYAWSFGSIQKIDCLACGEIYTRKWYGNKTPEEICVLAEAIHIWRDPNAPRSQAAATHSAQAIIDGISYISGTITDVSAQPTKTLSSWVADNLVNPTYWRPNSEITSCKSCLLNFERNGLKIHHCRNCGEGFCSNCSKIRMAVPKRGWGTELVRVCDSCRNELLKSENITAQDNDTEEESKNVRVRKYGEVLANCVSSVASVLEYPKDLIKDSARPDYWKADADSPNCVLCNHLFGSAEDMNRSQLLYRDGSSSSSNTSPVHTVIDNRRHHCRACGYAVCNRCSLNRKAVPEFGWNMNVRVCDECFKK